MVDCNCVSEIATFTCKSNFSAAGCKDRVSLACRNVDSQVLVFVREFFTDDADCRDDVRDALHPDFFVRREPVVDSFEINVVLAGRHVRKAVAFDDAVDFVGVVFKERLENILDSVFHNPQRIKSRKEFFVVRVLLDELRVVNTHFFVIHERLVNFCNVENEQN